LTGATDGHLIRDLICLEGWIKHFFSSDDKHLSGSHAKALEILLASSEGREKQHDVIRYRLPDSYNSKSGPVLFACTPDTYLPAAIKPATGLQEKEMVTTMIGELRANLALDLDANPSFERGLALQAGPQKSVDFLIIGSSNAKRLMTALSEMGFSAGLVNLPHFRIQRGSIEEPVRMAKQAIADLDPGTIIIHLLDNSSYCARASDGSRLPPKKGADGLYHMEGELKEL
jgi:hypothetical protein